MNHHDPIPAPDNAQLAADLAALVTILHDAGDWMKSEEIHKNHPRLAPRRVRQLAEASDGAILGCSAKGYRLTRQATPDEARHALADLNSRARKLQNRYRATAKAWHRAGHTS